MRKNVDISRSRGSSPMWYTAAAEYAQKRLGNRLDQSFYTDYPSNKHQFTGNGHRLVNSTRNILNTVRLDGSYKHGSSNKQRRSHYESRYPMDKIPSRSLSPRVVDMQTADLPIFGHNRTARSASAVKSPAKKKLAIAITADEYNETVAVHKNSRKMPSSSTAEATSQINLDVEDSSQTNVLPLILMPPSSIPEVAPRSEKTTEPTTKDCQTDNDRFDGGTAANLTTETTPDTAEQYNTNDYVGYQVDNQIANDDESDSEATAVALLDRHGKFDPDTESIDNSIIRDEENEENVVHFDSPLNTMHSSFSAQYPPCRCSLNTMMPLCEEANNLNKILRSCEVTEAHYVNFHSDDQSQTNLDQRMQSPSWAGMPCCMCSTQVRNLPCINAGQKPCAQNHIYGYSHPQSASGMRHNCRNCHTHGTVWNRPSGGQHQLPNQEIPDGSYYGMQPAMYSHPQNAVHEQQQQQQSLTELLTQQLQQQMQQAQDQIARLQMQLNCARGTQLHDLTHGMDNTEANGDLDTQPSTSKQSRRNCLQEVNLTSLTSDTLPTDGSISYHMEPGSPPLSLCPRTSPMMALGFYPMAPASLPQRQCNNCSQFTLSLPQITSRHHQMCSRHQYPSEFTTSLQQHPMQSPHCQGNYHYQPCCQQRHAHMRFMMPHCWSSK